MTKNFTIAIISVLVGYSALSIVLVEYLVLNNRMLGYY